MSMTLSTETERLVEARMRRGRFLSPDDVVRAALASLDQEDPLAPLADADLEQLYPGFRQKMAQGLAEADAGLATDGESFFAELERKEAATDQLNQGRPTG